MSITRSLFSKVIPVCAIVVGFAVPAMAQNSSNVDVSGGYNLEHVPGQTLPGGWYADVAGKVTPMFGVVGQITGNYKTIGAGGVSVDTKLHTFMGGVRGYAPASSGVVPYGEVLFGAAHWSGSSNLSGVLPFSVGLSETDAALQLGGGVQFVPAGSKVGAQVSIDYQRMFGNADANAFRFAAGVVIGF